MNIEWLLVMGEGFEPSNNNFKDCSLNRLSTPYNIKQTMRIELIRTSQRLCEPLVCILCYQCYPITQKENWKISYLKD